MFSVVSRERLGDGLNWEQMNSLAKSFAMKELGVRSYIWCLVIVVIFMGFEREKNAGGTFKVIIWGDKPSHKGERPVVMGKGGSHYVILLFWNFSYFEAVFLLDTVKKFTGYHVSLYYCCFTCFVSIEIWKISNL